MNQHIREIHNNPNEVPQSGEAGDDAELVMETVECEECGKELANPVMLYRHRKIHAAAEELPRFIGAEERRASRQFRAGVETVACEDCGKVLADPSSLYRHRKIHVREKPHKCPFCEK